MTDEQFNAARALRSEIAAINEALNTLLLERNCLDLPREMYDRHIAEKRAYLTNELARLEAAFDAL